MSPGKDLDALVAEKVMGHRLAAGPGQEIGIVLNVTELTRIPAYSTEIEAAERIEKELEKRGLGLVVLTDGDRDLWRAFPSDTRFGEWEVRAETAPHAICLAALKAVGVSP